MQLTVEWEISKYNKTLDCLRSLGSEQRRKHVCKRGVLESEPVSQRVSSQASITTLQAVDDVALPFDSDKEGQADYIMPLAEMCRMHFGRVS
jgi:hypothetical protein